MVNYIVNCLEYKRIRAKLKLKLKQKKTFRQQIWKTVNIFEIHFKNSNWNFPNGKIS